MRIEQMFKDDINRKINGVIKVNQDADDVLVQEIEEYVITKELKKHFITFFSSYNESFLEYTADIGVWISGFFGSGKSHFLKMLSYILENKEVDGISTVERFRKKFEEDPATFMMIDKATGAQTDTVLFNIDIEGSLTKDKTSVLRVFAKMFYKHLGYYGENFKVVKLEKYLDDSRKIETFKKRYLEITGRNWEAERVAFEFNEDSIVKSLIDAVEMSETAARNWFNYSDVEVTVASLVSEIKDYVERKPDNYRLIFLIDEVGQYVGGDTDLLLNLQSLLEEIGSKCGGKVWVICTGQEAIDEIIKARENEFSRIQARFKTRLSLSSTSADEVIQKRILSKTPESFVLLENVYGKNDSVLRNLFSFSGAILDIKGFNGSDEFVRTFPFVPYQFIMMQKVFAEIRKHGNSGKHLSGGERSMLSGFQEAAQKIQYKDEYALAPFYLFYDTVHTFLDGTIRRVIERCSRAAEEGDGIEPDDVDVLKLLYLIRYVDDIPANIDNISILMADDINIDKISTREKVRNSLDRLLSQNYIGRSGDVYNFLTDEEQDIQREIKRTTIDTSAIVEGIAKIIFSDIYRAPKFRYGKYDFVFEKKVDNYVYGGLVEGMKLRFLTDATMEEDKSELRMMTESKGREAIIVLSDSSYYDDIENAMKIRKYVKQRNVHQLPKSVQDIIRNHQEEANRYETAAIEHIRSAIEEGRFYADGELLTTLTGNAKNKIDQVLEYLVSHVYTELSLITKNAESEVDIIQILNGTADQGRIQGLEPNSDAATKVEEFLELRSAQNIPVSMADIHKRYSEIPYGWSELDIASVVARLVRDQRVTIKYAGTTIQPNNPKLPNMLRKRSEIGNTLVSKRTMISQIKVRELKEFLRDFFNVMDIPTDEDGLIYFIVEEFSQLRDHYTKLDERYNYRKYPDRELVKKSIDLVDSVLSEQKDNDALVDKIIVLQDKLYDHKEDMTNVESFFASQVALFDRAVKFEEELKNDLDYFKAGKDAKKSLDRIRLITMVDFNRKFDYQLIPELNGLISEVKSSHDQMLVNKRSELMEIVRQCMEAVHTVAGIESRARQYNEKADNYYTQLKDKIKETDSLAILDSLIIPMTEYKDKTVDLIQRVLNQEDDDKNNSGPSTKIAEEYELDGSIKELYRQVVFPAQILKTENDIDLYLDELRKKLIKELHDFDGIRIR